MFRGLFRKKQKSVKVTNEEDDPVKEASPIDSTSKKIARTILGHISTGYQHITLGTKKLQDLGMVEKPNKIPDESSFVRFFSICFLSLHCLCRSVLPFILLELLFK